MKKWTTLLFVCLFAMILTACNSTATPVEKEEDTSKETAGETKNEAKEEEPKVSELTLEEVYKKAMDRQNEIESLSSEITMDQVITSGGQEISVKSDMYYGYDNGSNGYVCKRYFYNGRPSNW